MFKFASSANAECASNTTENRNKKKTVNKSGNKKEETLAAACK